MYTLRAGWHTAGTSTYYPSTMSANGDASTNGAAAAGGSASPATAGGNAAVTVHVSVNGVPLTGSPFVPVTDPRQRMRALMSKRGSQVALAADTARWQGSPDEPVTHPARTPPKIYTYTYLPI